HMTGLAGNDFGDGYALILGLVGEHRAGDDVADGIDAGNGGHEVAVGANPATLVESDSGTFEPQTIGIRLAAGRDENGIRLDRLSVAALNRFEGDTGTLLGLADAGNFGAEFEFHALLGQHPLELLRNLAVHAAENRVEIF